MSTGPPGEEEEEGGEGEGEVQAEITLPNWTFFTTEAPSCNKTLVCSLLFTSTIGSRTLNCCGGGQAVCVSLAAIGEATKLPPGTHVYPFTSHLPRGCV